jgi:hypothetical protein
VYVTGAACGPLARGSTVRIDTIESPSFSTAPGASSSAATQEAWRTNWGHFLTTCLESSTSNGARQSSRRRS